MLNMVWLVPILPLIGAFLNGGYSFSGKKLVRPLVHTIACGAILGSFLVTLLTFIHFLGLPSEERSVTVTLFSWLNLTNVKADVAFLIDPLSLVMMMIITGVGSVIHIYSIGYMSHEKSYARYFAYLNLFCFAMLCLVMGSNLLILFVGWEGVGLCSYLLIGFWFHEKKNAVAGMKAFLVNRVGDFAFICGTMLLLWSLVSVGQGTVTYTELKGAVHLLTNQTVMGFPVLTVVTLLFFIGATGKSAQIPLYVWLPDAMAGPTPVSALIHAATMVTAGVYMIARLNFMYSLAPDTMNVVATVGYATAIFAASIGFTQNDIKKVLAYSTVSQLGFMFGAVGVGAYTAGVFHLMTHAFFKACLFLGSGSVIHAMSGEQDMRKMGGLKDHLPITYKTFLLATVAIAGIFPFAGFFSKDEILWHTFNKEPVLWCVGVLAALGTAIYMLRLVAMTFFGACRADEKTKHHIHESPATMTIPLIILAFLSVCGGLLGIPEALGHLVGWEHSNLLESWLEPVFAGPHHEVEAGHTMEYLLMIFSLGVALGGCYLGYTLYTRRQDIPERFVRRFPRLHRLVENKYYVDEIYQKFIVDNLLRLNQWLALFDQKVIDGIVNLTGSITKVGAFISGWFDRVFVDGLVNLSANLTLQGGRGLRLAQTGRIQDYLYVVVAISLLILFWRFS